MLAKEISVVFILTISQVFSQTVYNYCQADICGLTEFNHITCEATGEFSPSCPSDARSVPITEDIKAKILDLHNKHRNKIAGGNEPGYNTAAKMTTMTWNQELADYAELNVRRCYEQHDCHNTPQMKYAGQNLNIWAWTDHFADIPGFLEESVSAWWKEKQFASQANIDHAFGASSGPKQVFHFLEMASDRANQVGCAIAQWTDSDGKKDYIACNYSFTVITDHKVYESGPTASKCKTGTNPKYPSLCSVDEYVDPNDPFSE